MIYLFSISKDLNIEVSQSVRWVDTIGLTSDVVNNIRKSLAENARLIECEIPNDIDLNNKYLIFEGNKHYLIIMDVNFFITRNSSGSMTPQEWIKRLVTQHIREEKLDLFFSKHK